MCLATCATDQAAETLSYDRPYLLDTIIISEPLRPQPARTVLERLKRHQGELAIASIVWHELWFGCRRLPPSARRTVIESYLLEVVGPSVSVLSYGAREADWHALERARLTGKGLTPSFPDGQIASIAVTHELTLVTFNSSDFRVFSDVQCLSW